MWMSSNSSRNGKVPASISASIASRPRWIAASSSAEITPAAASMAACALEPARSSAASRRSKPIETLIACISASGLAEKRPPHMDCPRAGAASRPGSARAVFGALAMTDIRASETMEGSRRWPWVAAFWSAAAVGLAALVYVIVALFHQPAASPS